MLSGLLPYCLENSVPYDPMNQVHPGPTEPVDRVPADATQARTGNTEREQETWFAGIEEGQRRTEHNAAVRGQTDGWKLVPIEPTPKMIKAWHDIYSTAVVKTGRSSRAYDALIKAAPTPPASAQDDAKDERPEWMACESRRPWVTNSLKANAQELRDKEKRCRIAFNKDFMGMPSRYVADAYAEAAEVFEARLAAIAAQQHKGDE